MKEIERKKHEYEQYIMAHKKAVQKVWEDLKDTITYHHDRYHGFDFSPFLVPTSGDKVQLKGKNKPWHAQPLVQSINDNIALHDNSKFSEPEFEGYRKHFFPCENEIEDKKAWKSAVHYHYIKNPHHYQHWNLGGIKFEIKFEYLIEMMCDWASSYYPESPKKAPIQGFWTYSGNKFASDVVHSTSGAIILKWRQIFEDLIKTNRWIQEGAENVQD